MLRTFIRNNITSLIMKSLTIPEFDPNSIMMYGIPGTTNNQNYTFRINYILSNLDKNALRNTYPPAPPPPPFLLERENFQYSNNNSNIIILILVIIVILIFIIL